ncbi:hypothetical protein CDL12_10678 [Handroanthus impetiginosus]|uniref:LysM domain-containing protein n=1 Tax=Handroanthus impetiginosus TaxID=429701 RepID=A0A2G9HGP0_9LAMI|nr:hypothetical protein CDL12_10678 [Handroanthus impetiginosus]
MAPSSKYKHHLKASVIVIDAASLCCAIVLIALTLMSFTGNCVTDVEAVRGPQLVYRRPCDEIYVVGEGETLHTISDKCGDPYIVERNPHIHDPDDVFPGLVIKIVPKLSKPQ